MARFIIPFPYRKYTNNLREVTVDAPDLDRSMKILVESYEGLEVILAQPRLLSVFINGKLVGDQPPDWGKVKLQKDDEISLIIPIAGG